MPTLVATWTNAALEIASKAWGGIVPFPVIDEFRVGEGGWELTSAGQVPRTPDPTLTTLDCVANPGRYPSDSVATFSKALAAPQFSWSGNVLSVACTLDFGEFNDDGFGNDPEIYELGLFGPNTLTGMGQIMLAYCTFPVQVKNVAVTFPNVVRLAMGRG